MCAKSLSFFAIDNLCDFGIRLALLAELLNEAPS